MLNCVALRGDVMSSVSIGNHLPTYTSPCPLSLPFAVAFSPGVALINADAVATAFAVVSESAAASEKVFRFAFLLFRLLRHS